MDAGPRELEVSGLDLARDLDVLEVAEEGAGREEAVDEDVGSLGVVVVEREVDRGRLERGHASVEERERRHEGREARRPRRECGDAQVVRRSECGESQVALRVS